MAAKGMKQELVVEQKELKQSVVNGKVRTPCEVYSRVVGYLRPVQQWNEGKRTEYDDRVTFNEGCGSCKSHIQQK